MDPKLRHLSQTEVDRISRALDARGIRDECQECGGLCHLGRNYVIARSWDGREGAPTEGDRTVWHYVALVCEDCGYTRLYWGDRLLKAAKPSD